MYGEYSSSSSPSSSASAESNSDGDECVSEGDREIQTKNNGRACSSPSSSSNFHSQVQEVIDLDQIPSDNNEDEQEEWAEAEPLEGENGYSMKGGRRDPMKRFGNREWNKETKEALDRAVEYINLYIERHKSDCISIDFINRMMFHAKMFGANSKINYKSSNTIGIFPKSRPINLEKFYAYMDWLEARYGTDLWRLHFFCGTDFVWVARMRHNDQDMFFRCQVLTPIYEVVEYSSRRDWASVAHHISKISLYVAPQQTAKDHLMYLASVMAPYLPGIFFSSVQVLLESRRPISELSAQMCQTFSAFYLTSMKRYEWSENALVYFSHLLTFHIVNLYFPPRDRKTGKDPLNSHESDIRLNDNAKRRRVISLLNYCVDVERHLMEQQKLTKMGGEVTTGQAHVRKNRPLANHFPNFLVTLFDEPRDCVGLLPLAVWGACHFDCIEELTEHLVESCSRYPHLLIYAYNVLARFRQEPVAGQLFDKPFELALELLTTTPILLDILEQRSLDPTSYGPFDSVISVNLRALFMFLDYGRHRTDPRAWGLLHSNLCYLSLNGNEQLLAALVRPEWEKRKDWWPRFHAKGLPSDVEKVRKQVFTTIFSVFGIT